MSTNTFETFMGQSVLELKKLARSKRISGYGSMTKKALATALSQTTENNQDEHSDSVEEIVAPTTTTKKYYVNGSWVNAARVIQAAKEAGILHYKTHSTDELVSLLRGIEERYQDVTDEEKQNEIRYKKQKLSIAVNYDLYTVSTMMQRFDVLLRYQDEYEIVAFPPAIQDKINQLREETTNALNVIDNIRALQHQLRKESASPSEPTLD